MKTLITSRFNLFNKIGALILLALVIWPIDRASAADIFWTGATASYTNASLWSGGVVPGTADNAINANGIGNVVQINTGDPDWTVIDISAGGATDGAGAFEQNDQTVNVNGWMLLGSGVNATGTYTLNNGTLNVRGGRIFLGDHPNSTSVLNINGGTIYKTGDVFVLADGGWNGSGARTGIVNQAGGTVNSSSEIWIGQVALGTGIYNLHAGGTINSSNWFVVGRSGSEGTMNMDGGSVVQNSGGTPAFIVGDNGTGTLNHSGGTISTTAGEFWIANGGTSIGTNNISGTAVLNVNNWIAIGRGGTGVLNLSGGSITKGGGGNIVAPGNGLGIINQTGGSFTVNTGQIWLPENGTGIWNMSGGTNIVGVVHICQNNGSVGTINLDGGSFSASEITTGNAGGYSTLNLNGGTLLPTGNSLNFLHDLSVVSVSVGGAVIDTAGFNITIPQVLNNNGGGLTKNGAGTLTLTGANGYNGTTTVNGGKLASTTDSSGGGDYAVATGAALAVTVQFANAQLNVANLTLGTSTLELDLGAFGNPVSAPINVVGTFTVNGSTTINVADALPQVGQFPLVHYTTRSGAGNFVLGTIPVGVAAVIVTNEVNSTIDLNITSVNLPRWDGQDGGNWDIGITTNWVNIGTGLPTFYGEGNFVLFDDSALGVTTVNLVATVNPGSVTANNSSLPYTLTGSGKISGPTGLAKSGSGTFAVVNTGGNNYTGPTVISGGTLSVTNLANGGSPSAIGASSASPTNLVLGSAALSYSGPPASVNRGYSIQSTNSTIDVQSNLTLSGSVSAAAATGFIKTGPAQFTYAASGSNTLSGGFNPGYRVGEGPVLFDGSNGGQTNRIMNDLWVGGTPDFGASMVLSNTTLIVDSWLAVGRGNGTVGNVSTMTLDNSFFKAGNISLGYWNNIAGNLATQFLTLNDSIVTNAGTFNLAESAGSTATFTLNGSSTMTNRGDVNFGSGGGTATVNVNGTSIFGSNNRIQVGAANSTGTVVVANSAKINGNAWLSIGNGNNANGTLVIKDTATLYIGGDFNVTDTGTSVGSMTIQDSATVSGNAFYLGKAAGTVGVVTMSGGTFTARGGDFRCGSDGNATWNQTGGTVIVTNWAVIGRNAGSVGVYNLSGGSLVKVNSANRLNVGENGTGTLNVSGSGSVVMGASQFDVTSGAGSGTVNLNGGSITANRVTHLGAGSATFNFNGGALIAGNNANATFMNGLTTANVLSGGAVIDSDTNVINIGQALLDGAGGGGLTKIGSGTLRLNGVNTYTGTTLVNAGTIGGTGTIAGPVNVGAGAALAPGASIGTLTINNSLTLSSGSSTRVEVSIDSGATNDLVTGLSSVTYSGSLVVNNVGTNAITGGGVFKLFDSASSSGNFSSVAILPSGSGTFNPATGELTIAPVTPATINPPTISGGNLILTGTGAPGSPYTWLTSTNIAAPLATWTTNSTGVFDSGGAFSNAIPVNTSEPARFFLIRTP